MSLDTSIQGATLDRAVTVARQRRVDPKPFFQVHGFRSVPAAFADRRVPNSLFASFLAWASERCGDPHFGLRVGAACVPGDLGALGYLLTNAPSIGTGLAVAERWFAYQQDGGLFQVLAENPGEVELLYDGGDLPEEARRQDAECGLAIMANLLRSAGGGGPLEVRFQQALTTQERVLTAHFGCRVQGSCADNALVYGQEMLTRPLRGADPELFRILSEYVSLKVDDLPPKEDLVGEVKWRIRRSLPINGAPLSIIAEEIELGPRALQRRLSEAGRPFASLRDEARLETMSELARTPGANNVNLSAALGFANPSAFYKWRRRLSAIER